MADPGSPPRGPQDEVFLLPHSDEEAPGRQPTWPSRGAVWMVLLGAAVVSVALAAGLVHWRRPDASGAPALARAALQEEWSLPGSMPFVSGSTSEPDETTTTTTTTTSETVTTTTATATATLQDEQQVDGGHGDEGGDGGDDDEHRGSDDDVRRAKKTSTETSTTTTTTITTSTETTSTTTTSTVTVTTSTTSTTARRYVSLFCFTVISLTNYELDLMRLQMEKGLGVIACEDYAVFSDGKKWLSAGPTFLGQGPQMLVETVEVPNLHVSGATEVNSAALESSWLNTEDFMAVWEKVISDGVFRKRDWTVKVDPDAVFLPARLRAVLGTSTDIPVNKSTYLRNCKQDNLKCLLQLSLSRTYGVEWKTEEFPGSDNDAFHIEGCDDSHGDGPMCKQKGWGGGANVIKNQNDVPVAYGNCCNEANGVTSVNKRCIQKPHSAPGSSTTRMNGALEVISREAVELYASGKDRCVSAKKVGVDWSGWGEDWYMQWCLEFLGGRGVVRAVENFKVLSDTFCQALPQAKCRGPAAAFHPYKDIDSFLQCASETMQEENAPEMHSGLLRVQP